MIHPVGADHPSNVVPLLIGHYIDEGAAEYMCIFIHAH